MGFDVSGWLMGELAARDFIVACAGTGCSGVVCAIADDVIRLEAIKAIKAIKARTAAHVLNTPKSTE